MKAPGEAGGGTVAKGCAVSIIVVIALLLASFLAAAMYILGAQGDVDDLVSEWRGRSWPTTLAELNDWYLEPPREENAALLYIEGAELMDETKEPPEIDWPSGARTPAETLFAVDEYLAANVLAIAKAREAMARTAARYPIDYSDHITSVEEEIHYLRQSAALSRLLVLDATSQAEHGDSKRAVESLRNAFHVVQSWRGAPTFFPQTMHQALFHLSLEGMERVLARVNLTNEQLAALENALAKAFNPRSMERAFVGELCVYLENYNATMRNNEGGIWFSFDIHRILSFHDRLIKAGIQSPEQLLVTIVEFRNESSYPLLEMYVSTLSFMTNPLTALSAISFVRSETRFRATRIALAVEKYRARHGNLPDTLDALEPDFLTPLPQTVFGGEPFRYTIEGLGYAIESPDYEPGDAPITFTVVRVDDRSR